MCCKSAAGGRAVRACAVRGIPCGMIRCEISHPVIVIKALNPQAGRSGLPPRSALTAHVGSLLPRPAMRRGGGTVLLHTARSARSPAPSAAAGARQLHAVGGCPLTTQPVRSHALPTAQLPPLPASTRLCPPAASMGDSRLGSRGVAGTFKATRRAMYQVHRLTDTHYRLRSSTELAPTRITGFRCDSGCQYGVRYGARRTGNAGYGTSLMSKAWSQ